MALAGGCGGSGRGVETAQQRFPCGSTRYKLSLPPPHLRTRVSRDRRHSCTHTHIHVYIYFVHLQQTLVDTQDGGIYRRRRHDHMHLIILPMATPPYPTITPSPLPYQLVQQCRSSEPLVCTRSLSTTHRAV